jgi:putative phosphoribosyl transferase
MGKILEDARLRDRTGVFKDRIDAGEKLASLLIGVPEIRNPVVCVIPAGGVPIGVEVAMVLKCPISVTVVRKVRIPWNTEAGFGAVTWDGRVSIDRNLAAHLGISDEEVEKAVRETEENVKIRMEKFKGQLPVPQIAGASAILIDDGLASGYTMLATIESIRALGPETIVVAVPTAPATTANEVADRVDLLVCPNIRRSHFFAVASAYEQWHDLSDREVTGFLQRAASAGLF